MDYNINKMCRICLEEGVLTSVFTTEFQMMPADMIMLCAKVKVLKNDGMPSVICNNCIYRLGVAYHFKQQCENSDIRLKQYLGIMDRYWARDAETMTEEWLLIKVKKNDNEMIDKKKLKKGKLKPSRYKRKEPEDRKKRGPKPVPKVPQTCYQCDKTFKCAAQLQSHIRIHTGERPYACTYCPRRFIQKHNLAIHLRTHTGDKPFQCEVCSKQFSALGNFQAHKKIHAGVRDQICPACNRGFISSSDLARHMVTHTGIKNFHCDTCGKSFTRNRDMISHKKKIHMDERISDNFKCPECHKMFATSANLSIHFKTHGQATTIVQPSIIPPSMAAPAPIAPTALGGSLGPSTLTTSLGVGIALHPPTGLSFPQSGLSMIHTHSQRLHPY